MGRGAIDNRTPGDQEHCGCGKTETKIKKHGRRIGGEGDGSQYKLAQPALHPHHRHHGGAPPPPPPPPLSTTRAHVGHVQIRTCTCAASSTLPTFLLPPPPRLTTKKIQDAFFQFYLDSLSHQWAD
ncbi:hypothetical protein LZ32DRAFT_147443 [Colletotrichum eremochloae]|nr:hypothetical protein LZ32DRAFT_147443 [Colletotrichum eremochloae]